MTTDDLNLTSITYDGFLDVRLDLRSLLDAVEAAPPVDALEVLARELGHMVSADDVSFLIADFSGDSLFRMNNEHIDFPPITLSESIYDEAIRTQQVCVTQFARTTRLVAPVTDRGDALGVLELFLPFAPDDNIISFVASAAHALAYVVIANRRHTDLFELGQRTVPFTLAAEIQRRLLPDAFTCEGAEFTLAGWLEPANHSSGDTFDYSVERDSLHLSISDAKGHSIQAAQIATLTVSSLRNSRRARMSLTDKAVAANSALFENAGEEDFVTALLMHVDLATGKTTAINAGHPDPYLLRDGKVSRQTLNVALPIGMFNDSIYDDQTFVLRPGDRLMLVTDGMLERNAAQLDIVETLIATKDLHPREVVHALVRSVIEVSHGELEDDATVLCIDWYGRQAGSGNRIASAGASQYRASSAVPK